MIRCPLCGQKVYPNLFGVPECGTPGCGDGPVPSPERYAALQREWSVPVVINFCTPADLGRRAEAPAPPTTVTESEVSCHFFIDGNEVSHLAIEKMPRAHE